MARKRTEPEPLLTAVARKLGQAAGNLANMTHRLTNDISATEPERTRKARSVKAGKKNRTDGTKTRTKNRSTPQRKRKVALSDRNGSREKKSATKVKSRRKTSGRSKK